MARPSKYYDIVREMIQTHGQLFTLADLQSIAAHQEYSIHKTTLYRIIDQLIGDHFIEEVGSHNGAKLYGRTAEHTHGISCTNCGLTIHIPCNLLKELESHLAVFEKELTHSTSMQHISHNLHFNGNCNACEQ